MAVKNLPKPAWAMRVGRQICNSAIVCIMPATILYMQKRYKHIYGRILKAHLS